LRKKLAISAAAVLFAFAVTGLHGCGKAEKPPEAKPRTQAAAVPARPRARVLSVRPKPAGPAVALVIDDIGEDMASLESLAALKARLTVAVLPGRRHSADTARAARRAGIEVILHLPMQPKEDVAGLGQGALTTGMTPEAVEQTLADDLESVPRAAGVNNHMGSLYTADSDGMHALMSCLKGRGLFFVDSRTSPDSVATDEAEATGVKSASRDVFLDNSPDPADIQVQIDKLAEIAKRHGSAIGIGHPRPATLAALKTGIPRLEREGIRLVPVSTLVR